MYKASIHTRITERSSKLADMGQINTKYEC